MTEMRFAETEEHQTLPVILIVDRSSSMEHVIRDVTLGVNALISSLAGGLTSEIVALSVVEFNHAAAVKRPLRWLDQDVQPTRVGFTAAGQTNFGKALACAHTLLTTNLPLLSEHGWRPIVFFISDGKPETDQQARDDWRAIRERLLQIHFGTEDERGGPHIVALGIGNDNEQILREVASGPDLYRKFTPDAAGIKELLDAVTATVVGYAGGRRARIADAILAADRARSGKVRVFRYAQD